MYGAWIGDLAWSGNQFRSMDTECSVRFAEGSRLTGAGAATAAIASAIMKSRKEQFDRGKKAKPFRDFVREELSASGCGENRESGTAACVSPCGAAAVALMEAVYMARICAEAAGDPGTAREAEAAAGTVFLAKARKSKEEIRQFLSERGFDPEKRRNDIENATACFLGSADFEDAVRRALRAGSDRGSAVPVIAGAVAWRFYCARDPAGKPDESMLRIQAQAEPYIPDAFRSIEKEFHTMAAQRAGTYFRSGFCTPIMGEAEELEIRQKEKEEAAGGSGAAQEKNIQLPTDGVYFVPAGRKAAVQPDSLPFKPVVEAVEFLEEHEDRYFVREVLPVRTAGFRMMPNVNMLVAVIEEITDSSQRNQAYKGYTIRKLTEIIESSRDFYFGGSISWQNTKPGRIELKINLLRENRCPDPYPRHTIWEARKLPVLSAGHEPGSKSAYRDRSIGKTRMTIQLDNERLWFLSIFFDSRTGRLENYCLDCEAASDSHFEFKDENAVRKLLGQDGDNERYLDEIFIRYVSEKSGWELRKLIEPYITAHFYYD